MAEKKTNSLKASFWLTEQEKRYILVICALFLLGIAARYLFLKNRNPSPTIPAGVEQTEPNHE